MTPPVRVIADLPPPEHGQARVSACVVDRLAARGKVAVHDIAPAGGRRLPAVARALAAVAVRPSRALYMPVLAGRGTAVVIALAGLARLRGVPVALHHHSFAYLDRRWRTLAWLVRAAGPATEHVVLCPAMARRLRQRYGVRRTRVVGNAAVVAGPSSPTPSFVSPFPGAGEGGERVSRPGQCPMTIGFVGAVSRAKGVDAFLDLARRMAPDVRAVVAGPVADGDAAGVLAAASHELGERLTRRAASNDRDALFAGIDVLVLPSRYRHEAQPLVVLEALARGIPVIATGRGCLPGMAQPPALTVLPRDGATVAAAERALAHLTPRLDTARREARALYEALAADSAAGLDALTAYLAKSTSA
ncbi:Glycosyltransferase involved in cell wall bisynthesis [Limimonas halophila]|uniref:Glycosyltransferase involved in cell wall bisynthesis n=1 Tax=Limimonas halophila TaxID=1082479 RepID=A0A1G7S0J4_9PROT|nr:glycosyltransferase family 4 protein [Limimonas halophila]SDG15600.1 Glycosyltransferase involved in cell wall bisynthesis [Limimonas halophila]